MFSVNQGKIFIFALKNKIAITLNLILMGGKTTTISSSITLVVLMLNPLYRL